jgi:hypothetical protein
MTYDPLVELVRQRHKELRSYAAETAQARRARRGALPTVRRPLHLRVVTFFFGPR